MPHCTCNTWVDHLILDNFQLWRAESGTVYNPYIMFGCHFTSLPWSRRLKGGEWWGVGLLLPFLSSACGWRWAPVWAWFSHSCLVEPHPLALNVRRGVRDKGCMSLPFPPYCGSKVLLLWLNLTDHPTVSGPCVSSSEGPASLSHPQFPMVGQPPPNSTAWKWETGPCPIAHTWIIIVPQSTILCHLKSPHQSMTSVSSASYLLPHLCFSVRHFLS